MNLSYDWLKELVDFDLAPEALAAALTRVGCCVEELYPVGGDWCLVAEVTTNRPDWLCHWGVAHEIAAFTGGTLRLPTIELPPPVAPPASELTRVENQAPDLCPRYTARIIRGVRVAPSPDWLCRRLESVGLKPRNNVVDITNLVLFEMNQPLHAFDYDRLGEHRIVIRRATAGEPFESVFEEKRTLADSMCVIADADSSVALAGIKGGLGSSVTESTSTILLEAAYFDPGATRRTSRLAQLDSDSSYRFERGIDPGGVERASARACQLLVAICGGELCEGIIDTAPDLAAPWEATMRPSRCAALLGAEVPREEVLRIFTGLGLPVVREAADELTVQVPTSRQDLTREVDLIEEVARCHGYENLPTSVTMPLAVGHVAPETAAARQALEVLVGLGYHECCTDSFVPAAWTEQLAGYAGDTPPGLRIKNPVREDRPCLRSSLLPSLLEVRRVNHLVSDVRLFELRRIFVPQGASTAEPKRLCLLDDCGVPSVRGALEAVVADLRLGGVWRVEPLDTALPGYAPGTVAAAYLDGERVAVFGTAAPALVETYDLPAPPALLEADFDRLAAAPRRARDFQPLPRFPGVERDIALVVPEGLRWSEIEKAVRQLPEQVESVRFASVYRGKPIPAGRKSVAFSVLYRHPARSLRDEEANALRDDMVAHLTATLPDAALR